MPYHVRITPTDLRRRQRDIVVLDKDADWIETNIAAPRRRGESIFIDGQTIAWAFIDEIHITETDRISEEILPEIRALQRARRIATPMSDGWYVAHGGRDVTDKFLSGVPGVSSEGDTGADPKADDPGEKNTPAGLGEARKFLDFLATPRSTAVIGIASLVLSAVALVTSVATLAVLGVVAAIGFLVIEILNRRRLFVLIVASVVILLAGLAFARHYSNPGTTYFGYNDSLMVVPSNSPFAPSSPEIPLTANPSTGVIYGSITEGDGGYTPLSISCLQSGYFHHRQVLWAKIVGGPYESLWIPWTYLTGIQLGSARTLLYCSNWRWVLQNG